MTLALTGKTPRRRTALVLAAFFAIIGATLGAVWQFSGADANGSSGSSGGTIQVHKYLPKPNVNTPWKNEAKEAFTFQVFDNSQLSGTPIATFDQLGTPANNIPQEASVWLTEVTKPGYTSNGYWIPDADNSSGNDKCVDPTSPILSWPLEITPDMWTTKGNQDGLFHVCAYNTPTDVSPYFNLNVCYEGDLGSASTGARFGFKAKDYITEPTITRNDINTGLAVPFTNSELLGFISDNDFVRHYSDLYTQAGTHVWTVGIDPGGQKTATMTMGTTVTVDNRCPVTTGTLTVIKTVANDYGGTKAPEDFSIHVKSGGVDITAAPGSPYPGSSSGVTYTLDPGVYTISEDDVTGYHQAGWGGDCDEANNGTLTLAAGQALTCTIANAENAPEVPKRTLFVNKVVLGSVVDNANVFSGTVDSAMDLPWQTTNGVAVQVSSTLPAGVYHVHEDAEAGYTLKGFAVLYTGEGTVCPAAPETTGTEGIADLSGTNLVATVCVYNDPFVTINVHKTEQVGASTVDGAGWDVTLSGCGITPVTKTTDASGNASFENQPLCATYLVSEDLTSKAPLTYLVASGYQSSYVVNATTAGQTYTVLFANTLWSPPPYIPPLTFETPVISPTPETPTATATQPVIIVTPTATPTEAEAVEGEKTPGQQATPIAPETGSGSSGGSGTNIVLAGLGLAAISLGMATMALGRRRAR